MIVRFIKFFLTSGIGTIVDTIVLWFVSTYIFHSYVGQYIISPIISFECANLTNFIFAYFFVWDKRIENKTKKSFWGRFVLYNISCSVVFGIKMLFLLVVERFSGWNVVYCNLIALCLSGLVNFLITDKLIFKAKKR